MKSNPLITGLMAGLLCLSGAAAADAEVTIRVMEMNEISSDAVLNMIGLPESDPVNNRFRHAEQQGNTQSPEERGHRENQDSDPAREQLIELELEMQQEQQQQELIQEIEDNGPADGPGGPS